MNNSGRFEYKYRLTPGQYNRIRATLPAYFKADRYSDKMPGNKYFVRSLYFDTSNYHAYSEKMAGEYGRIKLRLRTYDSKAKTEDKIRVELKTRLGSIVHKYSTFVTQAKHEQFARNLHWQTKNDSVLIEFERLLQLRIMRPVVLIDYWREAYLPKTGEDIRLTFDHNICFAQSKSLFPAKSFFRSLGSQTIVMEAKWQQQSPVWLENLLRSYNLQSQPNSKYAQAIERTQPQIVWQ